MVRVLSLCGIVDNFRKINSMSLGLKISMASFCNILCEWKKLLLDILELNGKKRQTVVCVSI